MTTSILQSRGPASSAFPLSPLQSQVDGLVGSFAEQATDWRSLASMMAGGMAYRAGRIGVMGLGNGSALRVASVGLGLTAEVSTFEFAHRGLSSVTVGAHGRGPLNTNLWSWNGSGGIRQGLLQSFVTFGALKGAGRLGQGQNLIAQHLFQDTAMVLGHQITGALGIAPRPEGSLAEQFLHAEATNLQIGAGMALAGRFAPGLQALERGLDLSLSTSTPPPAPRSADENLAFAVAGARSATPREERRMEDLKKSSIAMSTHTRLEDVLPAGESRLPAEVPTISLDKVDYPPEIVEIIDRLEAQMTAPGYMEGSREELLAKRVNPEDIDRLWFFQLEDLVNRHRHQGARLRPLDAEALKESFSDKEREDLPRFENMGEPRPEVEPRYVTEALSRLGTRGEENSIARRVFEITIPKSLLFGGQNGTQETPTGIWLLDLIWVSEQALKNQIHFIRGDDQENYYFRLPSLSLFESLLKTVHPHKVRDFFQVWQTPTRDQMMHLRGENFSPLGYSRHPLPFVHADYPVQPAALTLHDAFFHAARDFNEASESLPGLSSFIYSSLLRGGRADLPPAERLLEELSEFLYLSHENPNGDVRKFLEDTLKQIRFGLPAAEVSQSRETPERLRQELEFLTYYLERAREDFPSHPLLALELDYFVQQVADLKKEIEAILPRFIEYPPEIEALLDELETRMTAPDYMEGTREELLAKRVDEESVDRIFFHQLPHFLNGVEGVTYEIFDVETLRDSTAGKESEFERPGSDLLQRGLALLGGRGREGSIARQVVEVKIPLGLFGEPSQFGPSENVIKKLNNLIQPIAVEEALNSQLQLHFGAEGGEALSIRIFSPSLMEKLFQAVHGIDSIQNHYVWGEIDRRSAARLRGKRTPPVGIVRYPIFFKEIDGVLSPASFTIHDGYFHGARDARMPEPYPAVAAWIYETICERIPSSNTSEKLLDLLSDLEITGVPPGNLPALLNFTLEPAANLMGSIHSGQKRGPALQTLGEAREFYQEYGRILGPAMENHPVLKDHGTAFSRELDFRLETLDRLIQAYEERSRSPGVTSVFLEESLELLSSSPSALRSWTHEAFRRVLENSLQAEAPLGSIPVVLLNILQADFLERLRETDINQRYISNLADGLWGREERDIERPPWMNALIPEAFRSDLSFETIRVPLGAEENKTDALPDLRTQLNFAYSTLSLIAFELQLPSEVLYYQEGDGTKVFRLPPPMLLIEAARRIFTSNAVNVEFTTRMSPQEEMERMLGDDTRPLLLSSRHQALHGVKGLHPYLAALHDLYHILRVSRVQPEVRRNFIEIYDALSNLQPHVSEKELIDLLKESIQDGNLGADADYNSFFRFIRNHAPTDNFLRGLALNLDTRFSGREEGRPILEAFHQELVAPHLKRLQRLALGGGKTSIRDLAEWSAIDPEAKRIFQETMAQYRASRQRIDSPATSTPAALFRQGNMQSQWPTVVSLLDHPDHFTGDRAALRLRRPDENWIDALFHAQAEEYALSLPQTSVRVLDDRALASTNPGPLARALEALGERGRPGSPARRVLEIKMPTELFHEGSVAEIFGPGKHYAPLTLLFEANSLLQGSARLVQRDEDFTSFYLPGLTLTERLLQAQFGAENAQFHFVHGTPPRDRVMDLRSHRVSIVGLSEGPIFWPDVGEEVPGVYVTLHDGLFHGVYDAARARLFPENMGRLYHFIRDRFSGHSYNEYTLDQLADLQHEVFPEGRLAPFVRSTMEFIGLAYRQSMLMVDRERLREVAQLEQISSFVNRWIRSQLPPPSQRREEDQEVLGNFLNVRRLIHEDFLRLSRAWRSSRP